MKKKLNIKSIEWSLMTEAFWADDDVKWWLNVKLLLLKMKLLLIKKENKEDESSDKDVKMCKVIMKSDTEEVQDWDEKKAMKSHKTCKNEVERWVKKRLMISSLRMNEEIDVQVSANDNWSKDEIKIELMSITDK